MVLFWEVVQEHGAVATRQWRQIIPSGLVTGVGGGTCNIIYTITGGCGGTKTAQQSITVTPTASVTSVTGLTPLCISGTATYTANGVVLAAGRALEQQQHSSSDGDATSGLVTGVSAGRAILHIHDNRWLRRNKDSSSDCYSQLLTCHLKHFRKSYTGMQRCRSYL